MAMDETIRTIKGDEAYKPEYTERVFSMLSPPYLPFVNLQNRQSAVSQLTSSQSESSEITFRGQDLSQWRKFKLKGDHDWRRVTPAVAKEVGPLV
jgi:hypothetical protein